MAVNPLRCFFMERILKFPLWSIIYKICYSTMLWKPVWSHFHVCSFPSASPIISKGNWVNANWIDWHIDADTWKLLWNNEAKGYSRVGVTHVWKGRSHVVVTCMWKGHSCVGVTHMWEGYLHVGGTHVWKGIHMSKLLTYGKGIQCGSYSNVGGVFTCGSYSRVEEGFITRTSHQSEILHSLTLFVKLVKCRAYQWPF